MNGINSNWVQRLNFDRWVQKWITTNDPHKRPAAYLQVIGCQASDSMKIQQLFLALLDAAKWSQVLQSISLLSKVYQKNFAILTSNSSSTLNNSEFTFFIQTIHTLKSFDKQSVWISSLNFLAFLSTVAAVVNCWNHKKRKHIISIYCRETCETELDNWLAAVRLSLESVWPALPDWPSGLPAACSSRVLFRM